MRWIAVWLLLTGVYLAGQLALLALLPGGGGYGREELLHLAAVPLVQTAALWVVALVRRHNRS